MSTRRDFLANSAFAAFAVSASTQGEPVLAAVRDSESAASSSSGALRTHKIPKTDLVTTRLAFGCAMLGMDWNDADFVRKTVPVINAAYDQGITFFDTADVYGYGKAEIALGEVLKQRPEVRRNIVIQSKCGDRFKDGGVVDLSRKHIAASVEGSLARVGTDHLDILLLHWPDTLVEPGEVAAVFDDLHRAGKVRYFGISNHSPYQIEILRKTVRQPLVINQIRLGMAYWYTTAETAAARLTHVVEGVTTLDYCSANDIQVQAYSPLRAGAAAKPPNLLNPGPDATPEVKNAAQAILDLANKYSVRPAAIMLAWLMRHPSHIVPIIGTTKAEHVAENCLADRVDLSREEWYALLHAAGKISAVQSI